MTKEYPKEKTLKQKYKKNPRRLKRENKYMQKCYKETEDEKIVCQCMFCDNDIVIKQYEEAICQKCKDKIEERNAMLGLIDIQAERWKIALKQANGNFQKACEIYDDMIIIR